MFDFLRKKLKSLLGIEEKTLKKKTKKSGKTKTEKKAQKKKLTKKGKITASKEEILTQSRNSLQTSQVDSEPENFPKKSSENIETKTELELETEETHPEEAPKENFFTRLVKRISSAQLTQEQFDEIFMELELTLLENNVALEAVDKIREHLSKELIGKNIKKEKAPEFVLQSLKDGILSLLIEPPNLLEQIKKSQQPYVILFFGINGTGKTTSIAKLAHLLKKNNISCVLSAADTFRAASIEQLKTHADKIGVPMVASEYGADPASVAFDAIAYAKKHHLKAVLIDTAGRMYTKENLLKEMEKIVRVAKPNLKLFVGESITGNDAIEQARTFNESIGIDGIILTKADIDEKAGAILSVSHVTQKPIFFLGTGQGLDDLTPFSKKTVLKNLGLE